MKLSIVIITLNEENNIERCLENIKDIADEIIVVDSFSVDKTEEICNKYSVSFFKKKFEGYIAQKNYASSLVNYDLVLNLDADETLSIELKKSIHEIKSNPQNNDAFKMNRCNNLCGDWIKHGLWYPDKKLRLYKTNKGKWGGIEPHAIFKINKSSKIGYLKGDILHYGYNSLDDLDMKYAKYSKISANYLFNLGKKAYWINLIVNPVWAFFKGFILRFGFLDGINGFILARTISFYTMSKYKAVLTLQAKNKN